ncbi:AMP-binding protein, partial [Undibacterium sp.]|uniref:AMP-binding protein n=1 Tax=Undibacterium sp. TaxID=1914977 RepID=UPI0037505C1C
MNANLYALFASHFPDDQSCCCIETHDSRYYSWSDIERASAMLANLLYSLELSAGARIAVQVEKSPEALILYLATLRAGYVFLPLNTAYQHAEITYFIQDASPEVVVCSPQNFGWVSQIAFQAGSKHVFTLDAPAQGNNRGSLLDRASTMSDQF